MRGLILSIWLTLTFLNNHSLRFVKGLRLLRVRTNNSAKTDSLIDRLIAQTVKRSLADRVKLQREHCSLRNMGDVSIG